ncbi:hypothetical protein ES703_79741 [subsurface metagenome]
MGFADLELHLADDPHLAFGPDEEFVFRVFAVDPFPLAGSDDFYGVNQVGHMSVPETVYSVAAGGQPPPDSGKQTGGASVEVEALCLQEMFHFPPSNARFDIERPLVFIQIHNLVHRGEIDHDGFLEGNNASYP